VLFGGLFGGLFGLVGLAYLCTERPVPQGGYFGIIFP